MPTSKDSPADPLLTCARVGAATGLLLVVAGPLLAFNEQGAPGVAATWGGLTLVALGLVVAALRSRRRAGFAALLVLAVGWALTWYALAFSPLVEIDAEPGHLVGFGIFVALPFLLLSMGVVALVGLTVVADRPVPALAALYGALLAAFALWACGSADWSILSSFRPLARPWLAVSSVVLLAGTFLAAAAGRYVAPHALPARAR